MLSLLSAVFCQYPRQRAPPVSQNLPQQRSQNYEQPPPYEEEDDYDYRPQPRNNVIYKPAPVHYVNIGAELAGDYKFGYDTGKGDNGGQSFREETRLPDGTVQGAYGYVDETGKQRIVKYTAGKEGFKVVSDAGSGEDKKPTQSNPKPRPSAPRQAYSQPEVHQQAYRQPQPQQAYRPSNQQSYNPTQQAYRPPQEVSRAQPVEYAPSSQPSYRVQSSPRAVPVPQRSYTPEPQSYTPEPQAYAPQPQAYAPRSTSRGRAGSRYVPERSSRYQDGEEDYDYPDNEITERRLAPIDTSLLNYNIGTTSNGGHA